MALIEAKCKNCGGMILVDNSREKGYCPFCGTEYYAEKIINNTYITNNYSGATINVQSADIDNYISLIENSIKTNNLDEAEKYLNDAFPYEPDNEILWFCKIKVVLFRMKKTLSDLCEYKHSGSYANSVQDNSRLALQKVYEKTTSSDKHIRILNIGKSFDINVEMSNVFDMTEKINQQSMIDEVFILMVNILVEFFKPLRDKETFYSLQEIEGISNDNKDDIWRLFKKYEASIYGQLINVFSDKRISNQALDSGLLSLVAQYNSFTQAERMYSSVIGFGTSSTIFLYCNYPKPDIYVKNKKGKNVKPLYFGTYLIYFIKQNHPNYNSQVLNQFESLLLQDDKGGCYIATCVYGSYDCPEVWVLRRYRDELLGLSWYGRDFIKVYYALSPLIVQHFGKYDWFKKIWKAFLDKKIKKLREIGLSSEPYCDK